MNKWCVAALAAGTIALAGCMDTDLRHGNTTLIDGDQGSALTKFETDVKFGTASVRVESKYGVGTSGCGGSGALNGTFLARLAPVMQRRAATQV